VNAGEPSFPRVTKIIELLVDLSWLDPDLLELAGERGSLVHSACDLIDGGGDGSGLSWERVDPTLVGYCRSYERFLKDSKFEVEQREQLVYSNKSKIKGHLDRTGRMLPKRNRKWSPVPEDVILDIKTGPPRPTTALQTAAYLRLYREMTGDLKPRSRWGLHLDKEGGNARLVEYSDPNDIHCFLGLAQAFHWADRKGVL